MPLNSSVRENGEIIISSGDRLTVETAADFARLASEALAASDKVAMEFDPALRIDITGVQIICAACKSAAVSGKSFSYHGLQPPGLAEMIAASGAERSTVCKHNNASSCVWFGGGN